MNIAISFIIIVFSIVGTCLCLTASVMCLIHLDYIPCILTLIMGLAWARLIWHEYEYAREI